jgi:uncharacterized protein YcbK (DUF882 family)
LAQVLRLPEEEQRRSKTKRTTKASLARIAVHFDSILTRNSSAEEAAFRLSSLQQLNVLKKDKKQNNFPEKDRKKDQRVVVLKYK